MGKINLRRTHIMLPSWIARLTEVKKSYRKAEVSVKDFVGLSPPGLARSLSLKRANARAKAHHRHENPGYEYEELHWFCKSIDALYVMPQMKEEYELHRTKSRREEDSVALRLCIEDSVDSNGEVEVEGRGLEDKGIDDVGIGGGIKMVMGGRRSKRVYGSTSFSACLPSHITSRSVKDGVALVKYSYNPYEDFRDSMLQMIAETNMDISDSDLEELLYCYFSMNSPELHDFIERAFTDVWIEVHAALIQS